MAFLVTLPIAGAIAVAFDKKIEEGIPVAMFIATFITYACGLFGILSVSPIVVGILAAIGVGYSIYGIVKERSIQRFLTFGMILFLVLGAYYALVSRGRMVSEQDDLQVYAKYVADFFHTNSIFRFDYIPGMMMWEYLSEKFWFVYSDSVLFWSIAMMCVGMMLAIFSSKEKRSYVHYIFVALFTVLFPLCISVREVYFVLQNDFVMGVIMAYIVCMYLKAREYDDKFYEYATFCGLAFLTLTKVTGTILAFILIVLLVGIDVISEKHELSLKSMAYIIKCFLSVMIAKLTWSIFTRIHGGHEKFSHFSRIILGLFKAHWYLIFVCIVAVAVLYFAFKWVVENGRTIVYISVLLIGSVGVYFYTYLVMPDEIKASAVLNYFNILFSTYAPDRNFGFGYNYLIPYAALLVVLMFIWMIMFVATQNKDIESRNVNAIIYVNVGLVIYSAFLFLSNYMTREAGQVARAKECERYIMAYIVFYALVCVYQFTIFEKINDKIYKLVVVFFYINLLMIANTSGVASKITEQDSFYDYDGLNFVDIGKYDRFFFVDQSGKMDGSRFNYCISPATMSNYYFSDMMVDGYWLGNDETDRYMTLEEWEDVLSSCTYVYVGSTNDQFEEMYGAFFDDEIVDGRIYHIDRSSGKLSIKSIEY